MSPNNPPFPLLSIKTGGFAAAARFHRFECGRFCCHRQLGPTTAESPTHARSDKCGTVTGGRDATVVLSHPSAAARAASSARGCRLKRRAHTALHESGHVRPPPAEDPRARLATLRRFKPRRNIPSGVPLPPRESHSEALLIRGSKPGPSGGSTGAPDRQSQGLLGCAVQATLECGV